MDMTDERLKRTAQALSFCCRTDGMPAVPSRAAIEEILNDYLALLFPAYFGRTGDGRTKETLLRELCRAVGAQIRAALALSGGEQSAADGVAIDVISALPDLHEKLEKDVTALYEGDPAAVGREEILLSYPGFLAIAVYRFAHEFYLRKIPYLPRMMTEYVHSRTGIDIHPGATVGEYFFIDHGTGIVIGETTTIGDHVKLYQGVTLGAKSFELDENGNPVKGIKRHPDIGNNVVIYAGATILGGTTVVGDGCTVGGNVWLTHSVEPGTTVVYEAAAGKHRGHTVDLQYFPGFVRKSLTFTIDDGNVVLDKKFLDIVRPAGILGTFNLCGTDARGMNADDYRELYRGYGIADHCRKHPYVITEAQKDFSYADGPADIHTAVRGVFYRTDRPGLYLTLHPTDDNRFVFYADRETYLSLVGECRSELEEVFGAGVAAGFVWPYNEQQDAALAEGIRALGFSSVRKTGCLLDTTAFSFPEDRMRWTYNANNRNLVGALETYEAFPDDGQLKFFCFGLHSHDYERDNDWDMLRTVAKTYGHRPDTYYYASVDDLFRYEDAVRAARVSADRVENPSDVPLYAKIDGRRVVIPAHGVCLF